MGGCGRGGGGGGDQVLQLWWVSAPRRQSEAREFWCSVDGGLSDAPQFLSTGAHCQALDVKAGGFQPAQVAEDIVCALRHCRFTRYERRKID
jgi:hypothetical protein